MMSQRFNKFLALTLIISILNPYFCYASNDSIVLNNKPVGSSVKSGVLNSNVITTTGTGLGDNAAGPGLTQSSTVISDNSPVETTLPQNTMPQNNNNTQSTATAVSNTINATQNIQNNINSTGAYNTTGPITYTKIQANDIKNITQPKVTADSCILINANTNEIYFSKNETKQLHPTSLPQVLASYLLLRDHKQEELLSVASEDYANLEKDASILQLYNGDMISVKNAILALMLKSACDIANTVGRFMSGTVAQFITLMNDTAKQIGCTNTTIANITGLNNDQHKSTAEDIAKIFQYCIRNDALVELMKTQKHTFPAGKRRDVLTVYNPMQLISKTSTNYYEGVVCGKQGFNSKALYNIVSLLEYKNQKLIAVVLKANASHYYDTKRLYDFAKTVVDHKIQEGTLQTTPAANTGYTASAANTVGTVNNQAAAASAVAQNNQNLTNIINNMTQNVLQNNQGAANVANGAIAAANAITNNTSTSNNTATSNMQSSGWHQDSYGWYYVNSDGHKLVNSWVTTDNKRYCVDQNGYMVTGFRDFSNGERYYFDETSGELKTNTWVNTALGAFYLDVNGKVERADRGTTKEISTPVGKYIIDENGKALSKVQ